MIAIQFKQHHAHGFNAKKKNLYWTIPAMHYLQSNKQNGGVA